jgi:L-amino acid N-acyltransferase YncA
MIRQATDDDVQAIAEIYNHYIQNTAVTFEEAPVTGSIVRDRIERNRAAGGLWLVAQENENVVGYAYSAPWNERAAYRRTVEISVYLAGNILSRGWGTQLYNALFARLRERDVHTVIGGIALPNPASIAIHEKFGMKKVAHLEEVGYKFGEWIDVGYWQVHLAD